jgi:hypothetical protein
MVNRNVTLDENGEWHELAQGFAFRYNYEYLSAFLVKGGKGVLIFRNDKDAIAVAAGDLIIMQRDDLLVAADPIRLLRVLS